MIRPARVVFIGVLLVGFILLGLGLAILSFLQGPQNEERQEVTRISVPSGSSATDVGRILEDEGIVSPGWAFARLLRVADVHRELKAGEYDFEPGLNPLEVMDILRTGRIVTVPVTIREGLTVAETAALMAQSELATEEELLAAFQNVELVAKYDADAVDLEGYLFPETYRFAHGTPATRIAREMTRTFEKTFLEPYADAIESSGFSVREIVALASVIEKETGAPQERPQIAGVFLDRLDRGMMLQSDPTIIFGLKMEKRWDGDIRRRDLTWDHPYNTYVHGGIPPGPIASPGLDALVAVLEPDRTGALYFVSRGDGTHYFSRTLREHQNAVRRYQLGGS